MMNQYKFSVYDSETRKLIVDDIIVSSKEFPVWSEFKKYIHSVYNEFRPGTKEFVNHRKMHALYMSIGFTIDYMTDAPKITWFDLNSAKEIELGGKCGIGFGLPSDLSGEIIPHCSRLTLWAEKVKEGESNGSI